jgi:hypothetical protein
MYLRELSSICIKPLRIAFDHLGLKKPYEDAVRMAHQFGLTELSNYMLYNFHDNPTDLYERMLLNVRLNLDLGIRIWSFPMRYQPTDRADRTFVGEKWKRYQLRSMQLILQATHGVVSGAPAFFKRAFGSTAEEFENLLLRPHKFIFNREWFDRLDGRDELAAFQSQFSRLSSSQKAELLHLVSFCDPRYFKDLVSQTSDSQLQKILRFYIPLPGKVEAEIWAEQKKRKSATQIPLIPDDERVEDAGLDDESMVVVTNETAKNPMGTSTV